MHYEEIPVKILFSNDMDTFGIFQVWEEDIENPDWVKLSLKFGEREIARSAEDFFSAMCAIRQIIEMEGMLLCCYGASKNVYPSGMSRNMGLGDKAYKLNKGQPAKMSDVVSIFETGPDIIPATVKEQEQYFHEWVESLGLFTTKIQ